MCLEAKVVERCSCVAATSSAERGAGDVGLLSSRKGKGDPHIVEGLGWSWLVHEAAAKGGVGGGRRWLQSVTAVRRASCSQRLLMGYRG